MRIKQILAGLFILVFIIVSSVLITQVIERLQDAEISIPQVENSKILGTTEDGIFVTRVIDGDTIELSTGERVRYIGIDAPESPNSKNAECFALEASLKNQELVLNKKVRMEKDVSENDRYGRLLRYVYVGDIFVNKELVLQGYALAKEYPPDTQHAELFKLSEIQAQTINAGIWSNCYDDNEMGQTLLEEIIQFINYGFQLLR